MQPAPNGQRLDGTGIFSVSSCLALVSCNLTQRDLSQFHSSIMTQVTIPHNWSYSQVSSRLTIFPCSALACLVLYKIQRRNPLTIGDTERSKVLQRLSFLGLIINKFSDAA